MNHKFPFKWYLKDGYPADGIEKNGLKVFSCFACGGGSTMGYKLAGFDVLGCNEIDKKIIEVYKLNHKPKYAFNQDIRDFRKLPDLPDELFNLDILDGSPPCSSFSVSGNREKDWGKQKQFTEGQAFQTLDDLFFEFIALADRLKPKVVISENVTGLLKGNAKGYVKQIFREFDKAGYNTQLFLLNAAFMGVPQRRQRVFFISTRKDLNLPKVKLEFDEKLIPLCELENIVGKRISDFNFNKYYKYKKNTDTGFRAISARKYNKVTQFNTQLIALNNVVYTIISSGGGKVVLHHTPHELSDQGLIQVGTFPIDFNFNGTNVKYLIGMSVPPVMTAQIATKIKEQLFNA